MMTMIDRTANVWGFMREIRWLDYAAFFAMGLLWVGFFVMFYAIYRVLRSKGRGDGGWGDSPGL